MEDINPSDAIEMFLTDQEDNVADATLYSYGSRLGHFERWCDEKEITSMADLDPLDIRQYRTWRKQDGDLNKVSVKTQMDTLRKFLRYCERLGVVVSEIHEAAQSPDLDRGENVRNQMLNPKRAETILDHLSKFHYAGFGHTVLLLAWSTAGRTGDLRAIDLADYSPNPDDSDASVGGPFLWFRHRPETETPLKNKTDGERPIALSKSVCSVLDDWIAQRRPEVIDEHGRKPLLTTQNGRASRTTIRETVYRWTRPCAVGKPCPHDREPENCEATNDQRKTASKCPSSVSPHPVRSGSITRFCREEVPKPIISDRCDVSPEVLEAHYNEMSEIEKMEQRREYLNRL